MTHKALDEGRLQPAPFYVKLVEKALQDYVDGSGKKTLSETARDIVASLDNPCAKIFDHKWLDPECVETGCQSLVWKSRYEAAVKGRQEFRQALRAERAHHQSETGAALTREGREALREALAEAYRKGATDVHNYWLNNPGEPPQGDPEFGEAASDYAHFAIELAALAQPVEAGEDET